MWFRNGMRAIRIKTLSAGVGPVLVGTAFVAHTGESPDGITFLLTLACVLLLQIGANLANDYYDFIHNVDGSDRIGPTRMSATGLISPRTIQRGFQFCLTSALLLGMFLVWLQSAPPIILGVGLVCTFLAWAYTGGPFPLSHYGLGELTALIIFGPIAVWGSSVLQLGPGLSASRPALYWGIGPGLIAASLMALNNLRDRHSDAASGKTTLATLLGEKSARRLVIIPVVLSSMVPLLGAWLSRQPQIALVALIPLIFASTWKHILTAPIDPQLNHSLAKIGAYLALYCSGLSLALAL